MSIYELSHYGVKGMKWGVRKDRKVLEKRYTKAIFKGDFNVQKGSYLYRATDNKNEQFKNRAYMTLRAKDADVYAGSDVLGDPLPYVDIYRSKDKIRVAGYESATKILSDTYNLNLKRPSGLYDAMDTIADTPKADIFMKSPKEYQRYKDALIKNGYDAVIDLVDAGEFTDTPIILLSDKKIKKGKQVLSDSDEWFSMVWS